MLKPEEADRNASCKTKTTKAGHLACYDHFATTTAIDGNTKFQAYSDCWRACYGAGSKLLLTLTFVSMLMAFVALWWTLFHKH